MHILQGEITRGFGLAARNLAHVAPLICARTGARRLTPGTLNVRLPASYLVEPDAVVGLDEYDGNECLKLQRCVVGGIQAVIVRPHQHETVPGWGHGPSHLELVSAVHLRSALGLTDGAPVRVEVGGDDAWWGRARRGGASLRSARVDRHLPRDLAGAVPCYVRQALRAA
jgi:CTP-dependent riboflavin kinase